MKERDTQRSKVYSAEHSAFHGAFYFRDGNADKFDTLDDATKFVERVWYSKFVRRKFPLASMHSAPFIKDGRGTTWARGSLRTLNLPVWARTKPVILHEIAHALAVGPQAGHGWQFAGRFLALVQRFMGREQARSLKTAFRANRVRWRPKRKLSPETLAMLRERGKALAAARKKDCSE